MIRLKLLIILLLAIPFAGGVALGQSSKVAVVDFERAVVESGEGKAAQAKFDAMLGEKKNEIEKKQREIEDIQKRLQTQEKVLSDAVKANLQRDIERRQVELTRMNEDTQKELETLRNDLLQPIAQRAGAILNAFAEEQNYTILVDISNPQNNVVFWNSRNDVTAELIRRIDATAPKPAPSAEPAAKPGAAPTPEKKP